MSEQEQEAIIGRLVKELGENKKRLACLRAKSSKMSEDLNRAALTLARQRNRHNEPETDILDACPDRQNVVDVARDIEAASAKIAEIRGYLQDAAPGFVEG